ncbi:MAG: ribonuclease HI [Phormidesmis sp.]
MPTVQEIYTDGACSGNPGPGGWGTRIEFSDGQVHELGGRDTATTNNRMEMQAAIAALDFLSQDKAAADSKLVLLHTDSEYVKNGITKWITGWKKKGWKTSAGKPVLNKDLWQQLDQLSQTLAEENLKVDWRYVRGHTGNPGNERCDEIARAYSHAQPISLSQYKAAAKNKSKQKETADKKSKDPLESYETSESQVKSNEQESDYRNLSISTLEINAATTEESFKEAALKSYEQAPDSNSQTMPSSDSKLIENGTSRIERLENALRTLQVTDELAKQGYLITSAELADLMDVNASAVTSRGDYWAWRNWTVSRIRREGNQILWQLERIDE